jgi:hypothetical protein
MHSLGCHRIAYIAEAAIDAAPGGNRGDENHLCAGRDVKRSWRGCVARATSRLGNVLRLRVG